MPRADNLPLKAGDTGFYRVQGVDYPARVVETGIRQACGPVDEIIVYTMHGWQDVVARTSGGYNSFDGGAWVPAEAHRAAEVEKAERELRAIAARLEALDA